jgi:ferredoxin-NADP reductase
MISLITKKRLNCNFAFVNPQSAILINYGGKEMNYTVRLLDKKLISEGILEISCEKPQGFRFQAGQFCFLNLPDIGFQDERGLRRHLSIASSPQEHKLLFATKISTSAFKKTLKEMPAGSQLEIENPLGFFILPEDASVPLVFLAGGIGITPFRSMIRYAADVPTGHTIILFYSNQIPEEAIFLQELQRISEMHRNIVIVATMTRMERSSEKWDGLTGRISPSVIRDNYSGWRNARYYIAGPPKMTDSMKEILVEMEISSEQIHTEKFTGYQ